MHPAAVEENVTLFLFNLSYGLEPPSDYGRLSSSYQICWSVVFIKGIGIWTCIALFESAYGAMIA